ncbi:hypothetical protein GH714_032567 [Hevea brasiliensis]|uniref:DUF4378 domain-containing protein n=1 Tax=Hevea brasiliensis TaxID=3981 RepID=A0A6A6L1V2_HEVBR|nr:hypothetical protein GH714_032567 [Hevea brasiliensis]
MVPGRRLLSDSMDYSCDMLQPIETDTDLLDSATSRNGCTSTKIVTDLLNRISRILLSIDLADGLTGSRLTMQGGDLDSELLFGSAAQPGTVTQIRSMERVPLCMNTEMLIEEVGKEIRRWTNLAGMIPDEIIEWEMSHSLGKWTDFEIESFETGAQIDWDILQVLVDELVTDFCGCRLGSL